jgi:hypothetical protein
MHCVKLNLAQIEELGDLVGFPIRKFLMISPTGEEYWVEEHLIHQYDKAGYVIKEGTNAVMSYAPPEWLPTDDVKGGILLLDDWNRADVRFVQAIMELIDRGEYISWSLPRGWHVTLSANPDNGDYMVQSQDNAQKTRYVSFEVGFDKDVWAQWAEHEGIDGRCINFVLLYPEIMKKEGGVQTINSRSLVTFFNTIQGLGDFQKTENLAKILMIADGCFSSKDNIVGSLFTTFLNNKLDKLIQPETMLEGKWETVAKELKACVGDHKKNTYRADIAATLTTRFLNYAMVYLDKPKSDSQILVTRILEMVNHDEDLLTMDLFFNMVKKLLAKDRKRMNKLLLDPKMHSVLLD